MIIVYLDQCAVSYLALRQPPQWTIIREMLEEGFKEEQIVCPFPPETLLETASCRDRALRLAIEAFFSQVSAGFRFRDFGELIIENSVALFRPDFEVEPLERINFHGWASRDDVALSLKDFHDGGCERMRGIISQHSYPPEAKEMCLDEIFRHAAMERSGALWRDLGQFSKGVRSKGGFELPWLIEGLIKYRMSNSEADRLREAVRRGKWAEIMENKIELLLASRWNHDVLHGQRPTYHPNDEIDRWRAVVALSRSDLFLTDKYMAGLCGRVKPIQGLPAKVIPVNRPDEIIRFLQLN